MLAICADVCGSLVVAEMVMMVSSVADDVVTTS